LEAHIGAAENGIKRAPGSMHQNPELRLEKGSEARHMEEVKQLKQR